MRCSETSVIGSATAHCSYQYRSILKSFVVLNNNNNNNNNNNASVLNKREHYLQDIKIRKK